MARCLGDRLDASPSVDAGVVHSSSFYLLFMRRGINETATTQGFVKDSLKFFPSILAQLVRRRPCERVMALWDENLTRCYSDNRHGHACWYIYLSLEAPAHREHRERESNTAVNATLNGSYWPAEILDAIFTSWKKKLLPVIQMLKTDFCFRPACLPSPFHHM